MMNRLIPTCANTYGQTGHVWRELIGGRRCDVCGRQEIVPDFTPQEIRFIERYALGILAKPRFVLGILDTSAS